MRSNPVMKRSVALKVTRWVRQPTTPGYGKPARSNSCAMRGNAGQLTHPNIVNRLRV